MALFVLKRLLSLILTLLAASLVVFLVLEVLPGDPAAVMLGINAQPDTLTAPACGNGPRPACDCALPHLGRRPARGRFRQQLHLWRAGGGADRRAAGCQPAARDPCDCPVDRPRNSPGGFRCFQPQPGWRLRRHGLCPDRCRDSQFLVCHPSDPAVRGQTGLDARRRLCRLGPGSGSGTSVPVVARRRPCPAASGDPGARDPLVSAGSAA